MLLKILAQIKQQDVHRRRRAWVWPRPQNWFKNLLASPALDFLWKEHFRVTRETFEFLCDLVRVKLQKQQTRFRSKQSSEMCVSSISRQMRTSLIDVSISLSCFDKA